MKRQPREEDEEAAGPRRARPAEGEKTGSSWPI